MPSVSYTDRQWDSEMSTKRRRVLPHPFVATLQGDNRASRAIGEGRIGIKTLSRLGVEHLQVPEFRRIFLHVLEMRDEHAELRSPIAHMILSNHPVTQRFENAHHGVADGRAQMPHVHFFRQVGTRVVHDDSVGARGLVDLHTCPRREPMNAGERVMLTKPGAFDRHGLGEIHVPQRFNDRRREGCAARFEPALQPPSHRWPGSRRIQGAWPRPSTVSATPPPPPRTAAPMRSCRNARRFIRPGWRLPPPAIPGCVPPPRMSRARLRAARGSPVPSDRMLRRCTKTSPPASRMMKPNPLVGSNHLTTPPSRSPLTLLPCPRRPRPAPALPRRCLLRAGSAGRHSRDETGNKNQRE